MRVSCLIVVVAMAFGSTASAEKVKTNQPAKIYSRPGEQAKVLLKVDEGQSMTLLEQEGRWIKVRVQGRTGYVPRSKVDMADDEDIARNTRRRPFVDGRSKKRGFGSEEGPEDRVGADAVGEGQEDEPKVKKSSKSEDDEEEAPKKKSKKSDDEEAPPPKKEKLSKKSKKSDDEEEAPKKKSKKNDDEEETPKKKSKKSDDEEETAKKSKKGDDDSKVTDDEDVVDDAKTGEPEEDNRPKAHVTKKVSIYEKPKSSSEEMFVARPNDVLYPIEEKGNWTYVENAEGDSGWVQSDFLEAEGGADEGGGGGPARKRTIDLGARLGLMFIQQGMRTAGSTIATVPDNYNITTSSLALSLGGGILMPFKKKYLLGGELTYDYAKTFFGGVFYDPDGAMGATPGVYTKVGIHNINLRGEAGYDFRNRKGMILFGRLGYRYQSYMVDDYNDPAKNPAKLPQEVVKAPTLGAALAIQNLTNKIGMMVSLDTILFGASVSQTKGLEDGQVPTTKAVALGAAVTYRWKKKMDLQANYDLRYMKIDFGPPVTTSMRGHTGSDIQRTDIFHVVTFGIARPF